MAAAASDERYEKNKRKTVSSWKRKCRIQIRGTNKSNWHSWLNNHRLTLGLPKHLANKSYDLKKNKIMLKFHPRWVNKISTIPVDFDQFVLMHLASECNLMRKVWGRWGRYEEGLWGRWGRYEEGEEGLRKVRKVWGRSLTLFPDVNAPGRYKHTSTKIMYIGDHLRR